MKILSGALVLAAIPVFAGIAAAQENEAKVDKLLKGDWEATVKLGDGELKTTLNFNDGRAAVRIGAQKINYTYKVIDEQTIELKQTEKKDAKARKTTFKVEGDKLTLSDAKGKHVFQRVKKSPDPKDG